MQPVKLGGLTLKSEEKKEETKEEFDFPINPNDATEEPAASQEIFSPTITNVPTITEELLRITKRVEELPNSDKVIKALAKLKGALELLS